MNAMRQMIQLLRHAFLLWRTERMIRRVRRALERRQRMAARQRKPD